MRNASYEILSSNTHLVVELLLNRKYIRCNVDQIKSNPYLSEQHVDGDDYQTIGDKRCSSHVYRAIGVT